MNDLKKQVEPFSEYQFRNENKMKKDPQISRFFCLLSTDILNLAKEIEELKKQNEELIKIKNHLEFSLSLKLIESVTAKIAEMVKIANDSQSNFGKLCILLDK